MRYKITYLFLFPLFWSLFPAGGSAAGITQYPPLNTPEFWQNLAVNGEKEIMDAAQIRAFNERIAAASPSVCRLKNYPEKIAGSTLRGWLAAPAVLNDALYVNGQIAGSQYKQTLLDERNLTGIAAGAAEISYGVTLRRTNLRALPSAAGLFETPGDTDFDMLQETAVDPFEAVIVLHTSKSGSFHYVQTKNYRGWIAAKDIVRLPRQDWLAYAEPAQFLTVTENSLALRVNGEDLVYQMGAKIPLVSADKNSYAIRAPGKTAAGQFAEQTISIGKIPALHIGCLPYTQNQIIAQSFKFLHDPYGWGGLKNSVDCSSFIANIYRTFGIELPRNADEQEMTAGTACRLQDLTAEQKKQALGRLQAGDALFFDGHVMLYLGQTNGAPFIIHALGSHTRHYPDGSREKIRAMQVVVSDLSLKRYNGKTFLDSLASAKSYH